MKQIFIDILAFTSILSGVLVITSKNPIHAIIFLISVFVNSAGYLILLGVGFMGIAYIIVYIGAITILFLFVVMMINIKLTDILETGSQYTKNIPLALAISSLFLYEILNIMPFTFKNISIISIFFNMFSNFNSLLLNTELIPDLVLLERVARLSIFRQLRKALTDICIKVVWYTFMR